MKPYKAKTSLKEVQIFLNYLGASIYEDYENLNIYIATSDEPVSFNDRETLSYKEFKVGDKWANKLFECGWMHVTGKVPPQQLNKEIVLRIDVSGEGCVFDGEGTPIRGLTNVNSVFEREHGNPKKTVVFLDEICCDSEIDLWVEIANNDLFGNNFGGTILQCSTAYLNTENRNYYYDVTFALDYLTAIDDKNPQYYAILYALCQSMAQVSSEFKYEEIVKARKILNKQLKKKNGDTFLDIDAIGHAHLDLAWLWPIRETKRKLGRTFATVVANMQKYPSYKFGASQAQQFEWLQEIYPKLFEKIKRKVEEGRIELQGGMWVEADTNLTGGESLIRQFLYGKKYFKENFGKDVKVCWLPDAFGYTGALPQIMKKCGMEYFLTIKMSWAEHFTIPHHTFRWQGIDGSEVLVHMPPEGTYNSSASPKALLNAQSNFVERGELEQAILLFGIGDGGGGPGKDHLERVERAKNFAGLPKVKQQFAEKTFEYFERKRKSLDVWKGELYLDRHQGTLTSAAENKKLNRRIENALSLTEKIGVTALINGGISYNKENLDKIWKEVLLYQFHDILPGSSIKRVYDESVPAYLNMLDKLKEYADFSAQSLGDELCVYNPNSFEREEIVFAGGKYYKVNAKPLAFTPLFKEYNGKGATSIRNKLENSKIKAVFDENGNVTITDKANKKEKIITGNGFIIYNEFMDCWDMSANFKDNECGKMQLVSRTNYKEGDCAVIEQKYTFNNSVLIEKAMLKDDGDIIDFRCNIDWQESYKMLRVEFEPSFKADVAVCDIQFGSIERPTYSSTEEQFGKYEVSMHKYVDVSQADYGVAIFNDCKYAANVKDGNISINLLRSQNYPCVNCDKGKHEFSYAVYPHKENRYNSDVVKKSTAYNQPLKVVKAKQTQPLFSLDNDGVLIETVKVSECGKGVVVRLYEANGKNVNAQFRTHFNFKEISQTDMLETKVDICYGNKECINLDFKPFEIKTLKITL